MGKTITCLLQDCKDSHDSKYSKVSHFKNILYKRKSVFSVLGVGLQLSSVGTI